MKQEIDRKRLMHIAGKQVAVYPSDLPNMPVVYLNTFAEESDQVFQALHDANCRDFSLVAISGLLWNHDMAPWDIPPISKDDTPCTGGADAYLRLLTQEIIPKAEDQIPGRAIWRGLAGYSLAGLFAVYSIYRTDAFSRIASMSGSLWFPEFREYAMAQEMKKKPEHLYFSLGDRECKTANPYLQVVREQTESMVAFYREKGIDTIFQLNPGGHYKNAAQRTAKGIAWLLEKVTRHAGEQDDNCPHLHAF